MNDCFICSYFILQFKNHIGLELGMRSKVFIHPAGALNLLPGDRDISVGNTSLLKGIVCLTLPGEGPSCSGDTMLEWHIRKRGGETTGCAPALPFHETGYWHHGVSLVCLLAHQDCPKISQWSEGGMAVKLLLNEICVLVTSSCVSLFLNVALCAAALCLFPSEITCWAYWLQLYQIQLHQIQYLHCWNGFRKAVCWHLVLNTSWVPYMSCCFVCL